MKPIQKHRIPIGRLVELDNGVRLFVTKHGRDCDGTPLYWLSWSTSETGPRVGGYGEDALIEIEIDDTQPENHDKKKLRELERKIAAQKRNDAEILLEGVCCAYCIMHNQLECPVQSAYPWSECRDFCGQYAPNPDIPEAKTIQQAILDDVKGG